MSPRKSSKESKAAQMEENQANRNVDGAKRAVLDKAVGDILKRYGDGSIMLLGEDEFRRWASLVILAGLGKDKPQELLVTSLIRANFCEALAEQMGWQSKKSELYLVGLLSLLDVFVGRPLPELLAEMPLSQAIKATLAADQSDFRPLLELVMLYEQASFADLDQVLQRVGLQAEAVAEVYLDAVDRTEKCLNLKGA